MDIANFDALKAQGKILDLADVDPEEDYLLIGKYNNKYTTDSFKYTKYPVWAIRAKDLIAVATDGVTILGDGTPGNPLTTTAVTAVQSVTGLDTDNTDPLNPIVNIAVDGVTITGQGTPASPLVANTGSTFQYEIGEYVPSEGGVIYHRFLTGTTQNYLVVDTQDLTQAVWSNIDSTASGATSLWDGQSNTNTITTQVGASSGAAFLCAGSTNNGKNDWYLPAIQELNKLWNNLLEVSQGIETAGGSQLVFDYYWSSTEYDFSLAWSFLFSSGNASNSYKYFTDYVRAVRKFSI